MPVVCHIYEIGMGAGSNLGERPSVASRGGALGKLSITHHRKMADFISQHS